MANNMHNNGKNGLFKTVTVIGAGSWGTAIANVIARNNPDMLVAMWAYEKDVVRSINTKHCNTAYLPEVTLHENIRAYQDVRESIKNTDAVILATPSKAVFDICSKINKHLSKTIYFAYVSKGFCKIDSRIVTMSQAIELAIPFLHETVCAIYGPSHAEEVCKEYHTALLIASKSKSSINFFVNLLSNEYLECIPENDIIGVDCGSTLKNPAAIAAGLISNLPQCGDNLAGALIAQAGKEMVQLGQCMGAKESTITGIAGLGDLVATALSRHSRNRRFGEEIALQITRKGTSLSLLDKIILRFKPHSVLERMSGRMQYLVEGAYAIKPIIELADKYDITMPVYRSLYDVLLNKRDPWLLIETIKHPAKYKLLTRRARIKTKERKKGIERMSGMIFKNVVIERMMKALTAEEKKQEVLIQKNEYLLRLQKYKQLSHYKGAGKETALYTNLNAVNYEQQVKKILEHYYESISDRYMYAFSLLMLKASRLFFYVYGLLYRRRMTEFFDERISLHGDIKYLKKIAITANPVYFCTANQIADSLFVVLALIKFIAIPLPRFYVDSKLAGNPLLRYCFKLSGAYVVNPLQSASLLYKETLSHYILTCVEHGIPVLYSDSSDMISGEASFQDDIISKLCDLLQQTSEEIAAVPVEVGHKYYNPVSHPVSYLKIFKNVSKVNISRPITLSALSASDTLFHDARMMLKLKQRHDIPLFPHYFIAYSLTIHGGSADLNTIKSDIEGILKLRNLKHRYSIEDLMHEGVDFLSAHACIDRNGDTITVKEGSAAAIDFFSSYIK